MNRLMVQMTRVAIEFASDDLKASAKFMYAAERDITEASTVSLRLRVKYTERRLQSARNQIDAALALLRSDHE